MIFCGPWLYMALKHRSRCGTSGKSVRQAGKCLARRQRKADLPCLIVFGIFLRKMSPDISQNTDSVERRDIKGEEKGNETFHEKAEPGR